MIKRNKVHISWLDIKDYRKGYGFYIIPTIRISIGPSIAFQWLFWGVEIYIADTFDTVEEFMEDM